MTMQIPSSGARPRGSSLQVARSIATSRPGLIAIALNWTSLVAIGAAPLILGILPCAAMCAIGLFVPMGGAKRNDASVSEDMASGSRQDDEPLVIEGTAQTVPIQSPGSLQNP